MVLVVKSARRWAATAERGMLMVSVGVLVVWAAGMA